MTALQLTRIAAQQPITSARVFLKEHGYQPGFGTLPGRMLYNVVGGDYVHGSTVTKETMIERGFKVEVVK
jgi:hypothetical protein